MDTTQLRTSERGMRPPPLSLSLNLSTCFRAVLDDFPAKEVGDPGVPLGVQCHSIR